MVEIKYSPGESWKNRTSLIGNSNILTRSLTSINAKHVNNKIIPTTKKIRCLNSSTCSEKGNSSFTAELSVKLKLELTGIQFIGFINCYFYRFYKLLVRFKSKFIKSIRAIYDK